MPGDESLEVSSNDTFFCFQPAGGLRNSIDFHTRLCLLHFECVRGGVRSTACSSYIKIC